MYKKLPSGMNGVCSSWTVLVFCPANSEHWFELLALALGMRYVAAEKWYFFSLEQKVQPKTNYFGGKKVDRTRRWFIAKDIVLTGNYPNYAAQMRVLAAVFPICSVFTDFVLDALRTMDDCAF